MDTRPFHELVYVSFLSAATPLTAVPQIAKQARLANKTMQITGVLVFDGERFCQYLEGSFSNVTQLFERISADVRHINVNLTHQGSIGNRHYSQFAMAYADVEVEDVISKVADERGIASRDAFLRMSGLIDFGP